MLQLLFESAEYIGTVAFAASGAMLAIDRELDLFGVVFLGVTTAVGGGIIRDILLGSFPPNAFQNSTYVAIAFAVSIIVFLVARFFGRGYWKNVAQINRVINLLDAVGLGIFSVIGARTGIRNGFGDNAFLCIFMGMTTGVGGGILRDLLSRTIPAVLKKHIYAIASILGASAYYLLERLHISSPAAMLAGLLVTVVVRILSTYYVWNLPIIRRMD